MTSKIYLLRPFTNLHVGSGDTNFGVIDKLIERDPASGFPCINSSGLRGALKQHFANTDTSIDIRRIFGSNADVNKKGKSANTGQGECFFLPAHLLALPVRTDKIPFVLATSPSLLQQFLNIYRDVFSVEHASKNPIEKFSKLITAANSAFTLKNDLENADLGTCGLKMKKITTPLSSEEQNAVLNIFNNTLHAVCIIPDEKIIELCNDLNLPVIARNALDDGESQNLWYEQILPRESLLYFSITWKNDLMTNAETAMQKPVQIGGNASVGYGFTKIHAL